MLKEIGEIAVFIICAQTLLHFRAKESYEKYIKLLISMIVLLLLLKPFFMGINDMEEEFLEELVVGYEREVGEAVFFDLEQADVEAVMLSMANEAVAGEEMERTLETQEGSAEESAGKAESSNGILIEKIQIGE